MIILATGALGWLRPQGTTEQHYADSGHHSHHPWDCDLGTAY